ncbi:hypothetical protein EEZ25_32910 [Micromonospora aurantiaca]|uniref:ATP-binding protein n=1 Tax=Micromonospora aurantiaca (nom. illeg.) TaxID=47850 RepID=UPI000F3C91A6|nr:ATP-binding protein [Micromonospora aurantiaca]RNH93613.1 hypothetical protein EEZ25_32910 [Micromonospora aurantiaca]
MTRVDAVRIKGLAGRKDLTDLQLDPKLNVIFGYNGCGKTSLLKIIHSALKSDATYIRRTPFLSAEVTFWSHNNEKHVVRSTTKADPATQRQVMVETDEGELLQVSTADMVGSPEAPVWVSESDGSRGYKHSYLPISRLVPDLRMTGPPRRQSNMSDEAELDRLFARHLEQVWQRYTNQLFSQVLHRQDSGIGDILESVFFSRRTSTESNLDTQAAFAVVLAFLRRQGSSVRSATIKRFRERYEGSAFLPLVVANIERLERDVQALVLQPGIVITAR